MKKGYFRFPHIHGDRIVFAAGDQLWLIGRAGGVAERLTDGAFQKLHPYFSPDGSEIAYTSTQSGRTEVHLIETSKPMTSRQISFSGAGLRTIGWRNAEILVTGNIDSPFPSAFSLHSIGRDGKAKALDLGPAGDWAESAEHGRVICRNEFLEASAWKRYRGGSRGELWIDRLGRGEFVPLTALDGNLSRPCWVKDRLYFLSDHEGLGNVYSCFADGEDLKKHTDRADFYVRHLSSDGQRLVFSCGGDLFVLDPAAGVEGLEVELPEPRDERQSVPLKTCLQELTIGPDGNSLAMVARGKLLVADPKIRQLSDEASEPLRLARWMGDEVIAVKEVEGTDFLVRICVKDGRESKFIGDFGRVLAMDVSSTGRRVALGNHRNELVLVDVVSGQAEILDRCDFDSVSDLCWSPDGKVLVYVYAKSPELRVLKAWSSGGITSLTDGPLRDRNPVFGADGDTLYFLSERSLKPVLGEFGSACSFSSSWQLCRMSLSAGAQNPEVLPPQAGTYPCVWAAKDLVLYVDQREQKMNLYSWDGKQESKVADGVSMTQVSGGTAALVRDSIVDLVRVGDGESLRSIHLTETEVEFSPPKEWQGLFATAWGLQQDFFFDPGMRGKDWRAVFNLYRPLVERLRSRSECSDLIWQMNGELETSHAYEFWREDGLDAKPPDTLKDRRCYEQWQRKNRDWVSEASRGRVGYIHVPNSFPAGYADFHLQYLHEHMKDGLVLDLRFCSGGNLCEFMLDRLCRKPLARVKPRWLEETTYPPMARRGGLVVLINGYCGSDGEMLAQSLRSLGRAKLIGTPTWGGVTGARGRTDLVGGGYVTQPRIQFDFEGQRTIENTGVLPDLRIEIKPQDFAENFDPQLEAALNEILKEAPFPQP